MSPLTLPDQHAIELESRSSFFRSSSPTGALTTLGLVLMTMQHQGHYPIAERFPTPVEIHRSEGTAALEGVRTVDERAVFAEIGRVYDTLLHSQTDLDEVARAVLNDNLWDLYEYE